MSFSTLSVHRDNIIALIIGTVNRKILIFGTFGALHKGEALILSTFDRIDNLLKQQGKKQVELCNYLGVGKNRYTDWKAGRIESWQKHLPKIAEFLGVSVEYLVGQTEKPTAEDDELSEYLEELRSRPEMKMLFSLAKGATKEDVEQAVAIIEALRKGKNG